MNFRKVFKAAFTIKNFVLLSAVILVSYLTEYLPFFLIGMAGYIYFVLQTMQSDKFKSEYMHEEALDELGRLSRECNSLYNRLSREFDRNTRGRLKDILQEKDELMTFFLAYKDDTIRQKIAEQALNLVIAYIKLMYSFNIRQRELGTLDTNEIAARIDRNTRKLGFLKDIRAVDELAKAIEMDEALLQRMVQEKKELERVYARLEYIESAINTFKHRIISQDESDPEVAEIETVLNEASALDSALGSNERSRIRQNPL